MPSPKPASTPRWATNGGTTTPPTSGHQDTGWTDGEQPSAEVLNWLENLDYQWFTYLNDFEAHALTWSALQTYSAGVAITGGNLAVSNNATVGGTLGVTGALSGSSATFSGAIAGASAAITNNATVGGTLGVTGALSGSSATFSGAISGASAAISGNATVGGTLGVTGLATFNNGISVPTGNASFAHDVAITGALTVGVPTPIVYATYDNPSTWANVSTKRKLCYWMDLSGTVHIAGAYHTLIMGPTYTDPVLFTIPSNYRPLVQVDDGSVRVTTGGSVIAVGSPITAGEIIDFTYRPDIAAAP